MIIDCHTHITNLQDLKEYNAKTKDSHFALTMRFLKFSAEYKSEFNKNIDGLIASNCKIAVIEGFDATADVKKQLAEIKINIEKRRIVGIKIFLGYQPIFADDERLKPVYEFANENNLTVIYHCGVVATADQKGTFYKYSSDLVRIDDVAVTYPNVNFVISHLGFPKMWDTAAIIMKNENVFTDISGLFEGDSKYYPALTKQFTKDIQVIQNYWPDIATKIMFGTDYSGDTSELNEVRSYIRVAKRAFKGNLLKDVFFNNAVRCYPRLGSYIQTCCTE